MMFKATIGIGLSKVVRFILDAENFDAAEAMLEDPPDELRERIEQLMNERRVDAESGWHNYEALGIATAWSGATERLADELRAAKVTADDLLGAVYALWYEDEFEFLREEYGTAKYDLGVARLRVRAERLKNQFGYQGFVSVLRKRGHEAESIVKLVRQTKR